LSELEKDFYAFSEWERELYRQALLAILAAGANTWQASEQAQRAVMDSKGATIYRVPPDEPGE
jgi:hypothetical protein